MTRRRSSVCASRFARVRAHLAATLSSARRRDLILLTALVGSVGSIAASLPAHADTFAVETAFATIAEIGRWTSIDVDAAGVPHIAHTGMRSGEGLWYATRASGNWSHECIRGLIYSQYVSLALDAAGDPRIAFSGGRQFALYYARRQGGAWTFEIADSAQSSYCSLELDADGNAHVAYQQTLGRLIYARRDANGWSAEIVDNVSAAYFSSLELDASGAPHIAYVDFRSGFFDLHYARKVAGAWVLEVVDDGPNTINLACALALDSLDTPHIAYHDATLGDLHYARKVGSVWVRQVVDDGAGIPTGYDAAIAIGPGRNPRIIYHPPSYDGDVFYATRVAGAWEISTVDTGGSIGRFESIVVDGAGRSHIAYQLDSSADLKYAVSTLPTSVASSPPLVRALEVTPNPAGLAGAEIRFRIATPGVGALALYDASGRRVIVLREGVLGAGEAMVHWGGFDASGQRVAPGVYFARLDVGAQSHTERLVLVR
jgi:hypothetical protein